MRSFYHVVNVSVEFFFDHPTARSDMTSSTRSLTSKSDCVRGTLPCNTRNCTPNRCARSSRSSVSVHCSPLQRAANKPRSVRTVFMDYWTILRAPGYHWRTVKRSRDGLVCGFRNRFSRNSTANSPFYFQVKTTMSQSPLRVCRLCLVLHIFLFSPHFSC